MAKQRNAVFYFRLAMGLIALLLPLVSLSIFGSLWLWQHGLVLYWAIGACCVTLLVYAIERWFFRVDLSDDTLAARRTAGEKDAADPAWSVREAAAWASVIEVADQVKPLEIASRDDVMDLGVKSIEAVARSMHPGEEHALWKFTLPEALALTERVSHQLAAFVSESIPLGDRMTVGQLLRVYRWRGAINVAEQAYDLWRIIRLMNPAAAATQEIREQLTRRAYDWGREELARKMARAYVREVGRAAIDLYSGRMRTVEVSHASPSGGANSSGVRGGRPDTSGHERPAPAPVQIVIVGQPQAGKEQLASALAQRAAASDLLVKPLIQVGPPIPPLGPPAKLNDLAAAVDNADLVIWAMSENDFNVDAQQAAYKLVRAQMASRVNRKPQPIVAVTFSSTVNSTVGTAMEAEIAAGLALNQKDVIAASSTAMASEQINAVWENVARHFPEAERIRALRTLEANKRKMNFGKLFKQVLNAGRSIARGES